MDRFSDDFMFERTREEMVLLSKSQNVITFQTAGSKGGRSKPVKAFNEQGIYMLMTILKGNLAVEQSESLIRLFKSMKVYHCGASSKDAGNRITTITRIMDIDDYKATIRAMLNNPALVLR